MGIPPEWLFKLLAKERKVIKGAKLHFAFACLLIFCISAFICYGFFELSLHLKNQTIESYRDRLDSLKDAVKKSPSQVVIYQEDPNLEKIFPTDTNAPAMAYGEGAKPTYQWSIKNQRWQ